MRPFIIPVVHYNEELVGDQCIVTSGFRQFVGVLDRYSHFDVLRRLEIASPKSAHLTMQRARPRAEDEEGKAASIDNGIESLKYSDVLQPDDGLTNEKRVEDAKLPSLEPVASRSSQLPLSKARTIALVITLTGAAFLNTLSVQASVIILPTIGRELNIPTAGQQWIVSSYSLAFGCFLLLWVSTVAVTLDESFADVLVVYNEGATRMHAKAQIGPARRCLREEADIHPRLGMGFSDDFGLSIRAQ